MYVYVCTCVCVCVCVCVAWITLHVYARARARVCVHVLQITTVLLSVKLSFLYFPLSPASVFRNNLSRIQHEQHCVAYVCMRVCTLESYLVERVTGRPRKTVP